MNTQEQDEKILIDKCEKIFDKAREERAIECLRDPGQDPSPFRVGLTAAINYAIVEWAYLRSEKERLTIALERIRDYRPLPEECDSNIPDAPYIKIAVVRGNIAREALNIK